MEKQLREEECFPQCGYLVLPRFLLRRGRALAFCGSLLSGFPTGKKQAEYGLRDL